MFSVALNFYVSRVRHNSHENKITLIFPLDFNVTLMFSLCSRAFSVYFLCHYFYKAPADNFKCNCTFITCCAFKNILRWRSEVVSGGKSNRGLFRSIWYKITTKIKTHFNCNVCSHGHHPFIRQSNGEPGEVEPDKVDARKYWNKSEAVI